MGAGTHGGFGDTKGAIRNRIGRIVKETVKSFDMALNPDRYMKTITKKYNIHLRGSGQKIEIIFNPKLPTGVFGRTRANNPFRIEIGPDALVSEIELANTIAHELNHARDFLRGGSAPEKRAYRSGNALAEYMRGKR